MKQANTVANLDDACKVLICFFFANGETIDYNVERDECAPVPRSLQVRGNGFRYPFNNFKQAIRKIRHDHKYQRSIMLFAENVDTVEYSW